MIKIENKKNKLNLFFFQNLKSVSVLYIKKTLYLFLKNSFRL